MVDYIDEAKDILSGCLFIPKEKISDDADIHSVKGLDSLSFETIILEIERRTGREVDPVELLQMNSVKDLARLLERAR
ncbi:acyl carrier protein [Microvirga sp. W0021]|uniref:Acyl carrier protein n=1 Tax=Hohaiivirga grylli TaxID=3133970 RepID=A0ABV0BG69_9HYPH